MPDYVSIEQVANEAIADMLKQRLEEAGIPCVIASGRTAALSGAGASYSVSVPAEQEDEARALLAP